jgi:hypothetical protein
MDFVIFFLAPRISHGEGEMCARIARENKVFGLPISPLLHPARFNERLGNYLGARCTRHGCVAKRGDWLRRGTKLEGFPSTG